MEWGREMDISFLFHAESKSGFFNIFSSLSYKFDSQSNISEASTSFTTSFAPTVEETITGTPNDMDSNTVRPNVSLHREGNNQHVHAPENPFYFIVTILTFVDYIPAIFIRSCQRITPYLQFPVFLRLPHITSQALFSAKGILYTL